MRILDVIELAPNEVRRGRPKGSVAAIREVHHFVAKAYALGIKPPEIAARINRTSATVRNMLAAPATAELVAQYANDRFDRLLAADMSEIDYGYSLKRQLRTLADEELLERLTVDPSQMKTRELLSLSADTSDRTGLARQETKVNLNLDIGARLDAARERSRAVQAAREVGGAANVVRLIRRA